ncbi:hypothetical protein VNO78_08137 [Psophocarpus tetragonolobus]|uniref:Secreted protein n=1 Tax=Psophocarpus tetragonolobus TaxID=3891 RepID=A0AAN9XSK7_PSOTE
MLTLFFQVFYVICSTLPYGLWRIPQIINCESKSKGSKYQRPASLTKNDNTRFFCTRLIETDEVTFSCHHWVNGRDNSTESLWFCIWN